MLAQQKPNVLFIMADDQGSMDLGSYGAKDLHTPHYPYQGDTHWLERFKDLPYPRNLYAAFVAAQDQRLGMLFKKLDDFGLRENTSIVF